jgi:hypothetical protein
LLSPNLLCQGGDDDEISTISFAPSLRIEMVSSMLKYKLALKRYVYLLLYLAQQDPRTMVLDRTRSVGLKEDLIL